MTLTHSEPSTLYQWGTKHVAPWEHWAGQRAGQPTGETSRGASTRACQEAGWITSQSGGTVASKNGC